MLSQLESVEQAEQAGARPAWPIWTRLLAFATRHPFICLFCLILISNIFGSAFNILYNFNLIVKRHMDDAQKSLFLDVALPIYNLLAYPAGIAIAAIVLRPLAYCRRQLLNHEQVDPELLQFARRRLINLPTYIIVLNLLFWLPGAVFFPLVICGLDGVLSLDKITVQFVVSFVVSAFITAASTFFLVERYLTVVLYPDFFRDARPAEIAAVIKFPFWLRMLLLWTAVALSPMLSLLVIALNPHQGDTEAAVLKDAQLLHSIALIVAVLGILSSGGISWLVTDDLQRWLREYASATERIRREHFSERIREKRPDEWGQLNDRFNDMASGLETGRQVHGLFGQFVGVEAQGEMLNMLQGLGGQVRDITVCFLDIRGFTRRSAGANPEQIVELLNQFLTLALAAVQSNGGMVNKFLGDGLMALYGGPPDWPENHADQAVRAGMDLVRQLEGLNRRLQEQGDAPLKIGMGIHSGPALVGCIGATVILPDGRQRPRKELTAIGETVNNCQRVEQLTKTCGGPILISEQTRLRLQTPVALKDLGVQQLERSNESLHIYEVIT